ncbi:hypothetical protein DUI87_03397 [Hirundo rustica rustica]|uniref:Uncharacterized protein n=1 Tax=Hirundo rustica rustica TaxID=333673 RepID=A0A3M0L2N5_HIRRU|nr:hypothetical protein DUI87_03397 [Hirundo rustica rustica]
MEFDPKSIMVGSNIWNRRLVEEGGVLYPMLSGWFSGEDGRATASCVESTVNGGVQSWEFYRPLERPGVQSSSPALLDLVQLGSSRCGFFSTAHFACRDNPPFPVINPEFPPFRLGALGVPRDQTAQDL